jgi:DNA-binding response OmpR family regulator
MLFRRGASTAARTFGLLGIDGELLRGRSEGMTRACKILIVDDDAELRHSLAEQLALHTEFVIAEAETANAALECVRRCAFDAILLDLDLPDMDGRELCRLIRRSKFPAPILMITAAGTEADTILGLDSGAAITSPRRFHLTALLARLRAQLRQHEQSEHASFAIEAKTLFR